MFHLTDLDWQVEKFRPDIRFFYAELAVGSDFHCRYFTVDQCKFPTCCVIRSGSVWMHALIPTCAHKEKRLDFWMFFIYIFDALISFCFYDLNRTNRGGSWRRSSAGPSTPRSGKSSAGFSSPATKVKVSKSWCLSWKNEVTC